MSGNSEGYSADTITNATVSALDLPLKDPFEISLGVQKAATNVLVSVELADGTVGFGEGSPIRPVTGETQSAAITTAETATEVLPGRPVSNYRSLIDELYSALPGNPSALFAVETAVLDAYCRLRDIPLSELFGGPPRPVKTDLTIGIAEPADAAEQAAQAIEARFTKLKLKTGTTVKEDVQRTVAVDREVSEATLKIDANQAWTPKERVRFADHVADAGVELELIEQPVPADNIDQLATATNRLSIPVAADESVFTPGDALQIVSAGAADILNLKLGKSGQLAAAEIVALANAAGRELMIGCMLESAIGIHTAAHIVAGTDAFQYVDLDANRSLADDVVASEPGPTLDITGPGHGVVPDDKYIPDDASH